jgi:hypothetical protein
MLLPLFEWFEASSLGQVVRNSVWMFPVTEAVHLLGLCLLGGAVLVVDLRMLGLGLTRQSIAELARSMRPWLIAAVVVMVTTGVLLFLSEAIKCYYNTSFWVKITTLPIALAFTLLVRQRVALAESFGTTARSRLVGAVSLALWFTVAAAGRWIGFS